MSNRALLSGLVALALTACRSPHGDPLPAGRGLVTADRAAPASTETFDAPQWAVGDRFVYEKAGASRISTRVEKIEDGRITLVDERGGSRTFLSTDLGDLGEQMADSESPSLTLDPGDARFAWPLWVGKRWTSEFTSRAPRRPDLPLLAYYVCDARESVTVPAGTFDCLRVWRRVRPEAAGNFLERVSVAWYAPKIGAVVKRLDDGLEIVLVEVQRQ